MKYTCYMWFLSLLFIFLDISAMYLLVFSLSFFLQNVVEFNFDGKCASTHFSSYTIGFNSLSEYNKHFPMTKKQTSQKKIRKCNQSIFLNPIIIMCNIMNSPINFMFNNLYVGQPMFM